MWLAKFVVVTMVVALAYAEKCPKGFTYLELTNSCIFELRDLQDYGTALTNCQTMSGSLWRMPTGVTSEQLQSFSKNASEDHWIGVARRQDTDFMWVQDGSSVSAVNWHYAPPSKGNDCVYTSEKNGESKWHGENCKGKKFSYCEISLEPKKCAPGHTYYQPENMCIWESGSWTTFNSGRDFCQLMGAKLVKDGTQKKKHFLKYLYTKLNGDHWIGARKGTDNKFRWVDDNTEATLTPWYSNPQPGKDCVALMRTKTYFVSRKCDDSYYILCEKPAVETLSTGCPEKFTAFPKTASCVVEVKHPQTFTYAQKNCMALGGSLWKMPTGLTTAQLSEVTNDTRNHHWIGISRRGDNHFAWIKDFKPVLSTNWKSDEPSVGYDCVYTGESNGASQWSGGNCNTKMPFYCEIILKPKKCPTGFEYYEPDNICVIEFTRSNTHEVSRNLCHALGAELSKASTKDKMRFLQIVGLYASHWVGAKRIPSSPPKTITVTWTGKRSISDDVYRWDVDNTTSSNLEMMFTPSQDKSCLQSYPGGFKFYGMKCEEIRGYFFCDMSPSPPPSTPECPAEWTMSSDKRRCMKTITDKKRTWQKARDNCKTLGGDLVSIPVQEDLDIVKGMLGKPRYWIGLHDHDGDGKFVWLNDTDETKVTNFRFPPKNHAGNEHCVEMIGNHGGKWNDKRCKVKRYSICQKDVNLV